MVSCRPPMSQFAPRPTDGPQKTGGAPKLSAAARRVRMSRDAARERHDLLFGELSKHRAKQRAAALCLSGGGIRSATFGLGVLQGLARHGVLDRFHYLFRRKVERYLEQGNGTASLQSEMVAALRELAAGMVESAPPR